MISIIILTHNSASFIKPCLDSVFAQQSRDLEVIVIDNGSKDNTLDQIKSYGQRVRLIENRDNLGPCRGRNQGIAVSKGSWVLTLDCDVVLDRNFINSVDQRLKSLDSRIGMIQPKILNPDNTTI